MQGVIREEAAKIKTLSHVKGSVREELVVNFKDVSCTLTNKLIDEESKICKEWNLKIVISSCEESCIKAECFFDKVVNFISHDNRSPFVFCGYRCNVL